MLPSRLADEDAFGRIVAQDMVLQEEFQCLPPVILDDDQPTMLEGNVLVTTGDILSGTGARSQKLSYLELRLDWYSLLPNVLEYLQCNRILN